MSPEEIERTIQFLLSQQAQFAVDMEKLSAKTDRVADGLIGLTSIVGRMAEHSAASQDRTDEQLRDTAASQDRTDQQLRETARNLAELEALFHRHLREDHGRKPS